MSPRSKHTVWPSLDRPSRRTTVALTALFALAVVASCVGSSHAAAASATTEDDAQIEVSELEVDFGLERQALTRTITLTFETVDPSTVEDLSIEVLGDLSRSDRMAQFPASQITPSATLSGSTARITVIVDPTTPEEVEAGSYQGKLRLTGAGIQPSEVPLSVELLPRDGWTLFWAGLILFAGAIFGAIVRYTNDTGQALGDLRRRFNRLSLTYDQFDSHDLPTTISRTVAKTKLALQQRDLRPAEGAIQKLEGQEQLMSLAEDLKVLRTSVEAQERVAETSALSAHVVPVVTKERQVIRTIKSTKVDRLDDARSTTSANVSYFLAIEILIRHIASLEEQGQDTSECVDLLTTFGTTESLHDAYTSAWPRIKNLQVKDVTRRRPSEVSGIAKPFVFSWRLFANWWRHRIGRFVDVRNVVIFFAAILVMLIGLETQFFNDAGFDGGIRFFLELFAWAAAIQIVGVELAQLGSQLYGKRPSAVGEVGTPGRS